jgi:hypothetical protein
MAHVFVKTAPAYLQHPAHQGHRPGLLMPPVEVEFQFDSFGKKAVVFFKITLSKGYLC